VKAIRSKPILLVAVLWIGAGAVLTLAAKSAGGADVDPAAVQKKAGTPPPASATKGTAAGADSMEIATANGDADSDSVWVEEIDIDGDGTVEETTLVWDDEDKVLFAYSEGTFTCDNGGTGEGGMLVAVNAKDNPRKRPAGSGFWIVEIDETECGAEAAAMMGCQFNAKGKDTACGVATIDEDDDDIVVVAAEDDDE
jgi:hypothetical protein